MNTVNKIVIFGLIGLFCWNNSFADKLKIEGSGSGKPKSTESVTAGCAPGAGSTYIELNNVRALIHTGGDMWWDLQGKAKYEVPKGSGKTALFAGSIWIGGQDVNGQLKLAAITYRADGVDYWPGPLITSGDAQASVSPEICVQYDRHFTITKNEVAQFRAWFRSPAAERGTNFPGYSIPNIIQNWPAHGPGSGYDTYLAPFHDENGDNFYNPSDGDYPFFDLDNSLPCGTTREMRKPRLYGDQSLWWVYNDRGNLHTETGGDAIGFEIRGQAFAFATNDELNNMTFYNYALINRSTYTLKETYFGVWTDADMGYAQDDYVESDVQRGLGILYNGKSIDGTGQPEAYGGPYPPPPAIGIDFFEGPYKDANGIDDLSSYDENGNLDCVGGFRLNKHTGNREYIGAGDILNGNINGLNFGDSVADNERWGMRRFIYYNNGGCNDMCDPQTAIQFYQYLRGYWKDGTRLTYGTTGHNLSGMATDFMFPALTDKCNWGTGGLVPPAPTNPTLGWCEKGEGNPPNDRRLIQSAGPFTLEPGAVNDITTGAVWARATSGDEYASVQMVKLADDKAQKLFENCFKVLDGPDAPELKIIALDKKLIFHIYNTPNSNNYLEKYAQADPFIVCPVSAPGCDKKYKFQGYQVFQLVNQFASTSELHDPNKARLVFQCDKKDGVNKLINFTWSDEMKANVPVMEVNGSDEGIKHSFVVTEDAFATGDKRLVNNKKYYYVAIAYAYNNYQKYDQNDISSWSGQKMPYKAGRKGASGAIKIYGLGDEPVIPHITAPENDGTIINASFGDGVEVTQIEGHGNGYNNLDLTTETINEIMSGAPWKAKAPKYKAGRGPIDVKIIDPLNLKNDSYTLKFTEAECHVLEDAATIADTVSFMRKNGLIKKANWIVINSKNDTIKSDQAIIVDDEKIIVDWGISVKIQQVGMPLSKGNTIKGYIINADSPIANDSVLGPIDNGGVIEATMENADNTSPWLYFFSDQEGSVPENWIHSGSFVDPDNAINNDYVYQVSADASAPWDNAQNYEKLLSGGWAPYFLCSYGPSAPGFDSAFKAVQSPPLYFSNNGNIDLANGIGANTGLSSVDIVITTDKSKWTRCPVLEMCDNKIRAEGNASKFDMRRSPSVDRDGKTGTAEATANGTQPYGMGYFPGYAIDVETGERLNMMFGEDSWEVSDNGRDMLWNPSNNQFTMGGRHFIFVMGNPVYNLTHMSRKPRIWPDHIFMLKSDKSRWELTNYDEGKFAYTYLNARTLAASENNSDSTLASKTKYKRTLMTSIMWAGIPMLSQGYSFTNKYIPHSDVKVRLRVAKPYRKGFRSWAVANPQNNNFPMYTFNTTNVKSTIGDNPTAKNALDLICVIPNPYYGFSSYEQSQTDNLVKIVNLPRKCTVSIYSLGGTLIKRFGKDNSSTIIEWDLKNTYGISIAGGMYIIHIDAPGIGEKIVKWFGALRPTDLNAF